MNKQADIEWLDSLDHNDQDNLLKFLITENKKVCFSKVTTKKKDAPRFVKFNNGARTKWHYHTKKQLLVWAKGEGFVDIASKDGSTKTFSLSSENKKVKIPAYVAHCHGAEEHTAEFIHHSTQKGRTVWLEDHRHYKSTNLDTFENELNSQFSEKHLKIYTEVNSNYRHLADIRFKLLALVPAISLAAWLSLFKVLDSAIFFHNIIGVIISLLALRIIYGIKIYDQRNDDLYDDLIARGRKIEDEMGVFTGIFKGRKKGIRVYRIFNFIKFQINHSIGLDLIYSSVQCGWFLILFFFAFQFVKQVILNIEALIG